MENKKTIYWHEAFYEALQLEFYEYKNVLNFENEHMLSKESLKIDVVVIKKTSDIEIKKNIGKIFESYNIFEFKSEHDYLSINAYNKGLAYAFLYSSFQNINTSDITIGNVAKPHEV